MKRLVCALILVISALALPVWAAVSAVFAPCDTNFFQAFICPSQSVFIGGNIYDEQNLSGTTVLPEASWDGTDSVLIVNLTILPPALNQITATYCKNEALLVNGHIYDASNPTGMEYLPGAAYMGCDSVIAINLSFLYEANQHLQQTICAGDTVWVNNQAYDQYYYKGMETIIGGAANGCDSVILVDLIVLPIAADTFFQTICPDAFIKVNGRVYNKTHPQGIETLPNFALNGCDSIVYVSISFYDPLDDPDFLGQNQSVNLGESVCLQVPEAPNTFTIEWSDQLPCVDGDCTSVCFWATKSQWLICTISDTNSCVFSDSVRIDVSKTRPVYIPNVFNPEGSPPNNRFQVFSGIEGTRINWLSIWDRWGSLVYSAKDLDADDSNMGWDGTIKAKIAQPNVFTYALELFYPDGEKEIRSGTVTLLRGF